MSCFHGNSIGACDICDEVDAAYASGLAAGKLSVEQPVRSVSDEDVRGACRAFYGERWLRMEQEQPMRWMRAALEHFAASAQEKQS